MPFASGKIEQADTVLFKDLCSMNTGGLMDIHGSRDAMQTIARKHGAVKVHQVEFLIRKILLEKLNEMNISELMDFHGSRKDLMNWKSN